MNKSPFLRRKTPSVAPSAWLPSVQPFTSGGTKRKISTGKTRLASLPHIIVVGGKQQARFEKRNIDKWFCLHGTNRNARYMPSPSPRQSQTCPAPLPQATLAVPTLQKSVAGRGSEPAMISTGQLVGSSGRAWFTITAVSLSLSPRSPQTSLLPQR